MDMKFFALLQYFERESLRHYFEGLYREFESV